MPAARSSPSPRAGLTTFPGDREPTTDDVRAPLHLAIGMFDGMHRGHRRVIGEAVGECRKSGRGIPAVLTFDPHPSRILRPDQSTALLMPLAQRINEMLRFGVERVFVQAFTLEYARLEAEGFLPLLLKQFPGLESIHVGGNFRYGAKRSGTVTTLAEAGKVHGIRVHSLDREVHDGRPISSSRIREALREGRIDRVNDMLGRPYTIEGEVAPGRRIGRTIGFPTLNISWHPPAAPRFGVYKVAVKTRSGEPPVAGIANYGVRPTLGEDGKPVLEVHLLGAGPVPGTGDPVRVALLDFIRGEKQFDSLDSLRKQIRKDADLVKSSIQSHPVGQLVDF